MERFWNKVDVKGPDDCWKWKAYKNKDGYGHFCLNGKTERAHRISFLLEKGYWTEKCICHSCDNPSCVNPSHLWEGTIKENAIDRTKKGRSKGSCLIGEKNPAVKLTVQQVNEIREQRFGGVLLKTLAKKYGVSFQHISLIVRNKTWKK